jgi:hypothetical protein
MGVRGNAAVVLAGDREGIVLRGDVVESCFAAVAGRVLARIET